MSVSEISFCIDCGNSVKGSKYCSKCGKEVVRTALDPEENNVDLKENNQVKKTKLFKTHIEKTENDSNNRIDFKETEDIGSVTHYNGKPFTGVGFRLYNNGGIKSEVSLLNGLAHGMTKFYNEKGEVVETSLFEKDKETVSASAMKKKETLKKSSNNWAQIWVTLTFPALGVFFNNPVNMDGNPIEIFMDVTVSLFITGFVVSFCLLIAWLTNLVIKAKSFWNIALIISVCLSLLLGLGAFAKT